MIVRLYAARVLLERGGQLDELQAALRRARWREGTLVLVSGEAGIGKTSLAGRSRRRSRTGRGCSPGRATTCWRRARSGRSGTWLPPGPRRARGRPGGAGPGAAAGVPAADDGRRPARRPAARRPRAGGARPGRRPRAGVRAARQSGRGRGGLRRGRPPVHPGGRGRAGRGPAGRQDARAGPLGVARVGLGDEAGWTTCASRSTWPAGSTTATTCAGPRRTRPRR